VLLIVIVALVSTVAFYRQAKRIGVHAGKAAGVPFIAAGIFLAFTYISSFGINYVGVAMNASVATVRTVFVDVKHFCNRRIYDTDCSQLAGAYDRWLGS